jgi:predicted nucleic acid-binding protein
MQIRDYAIEDSLIAATAHAHGFTVVTRNMREGNAHMRISCSRSSH